MSLLRVYRDCNMCAKSFRAWDSFSFNRQRREAGGEENSPVFSVICRQLRCLKLPRDAASLSLSSFFFSVCFFPLFPTFVHFERAVSRTPLSPRRRSSHLTTRCEVHPSSRHVCHTARRGAEFSDWLAFFSSSRFHRDPMTPVAGQWGYLFI